ncbi:MAG: sugar isomerase [Cyanobacteria bacterium RYN_339]|nr:sugar isomerase [Cyanobacteria bacterium RYN_339]
MDVTPPNPPQPPEIEQAVALLVACYLRTCKLLVCGDEGAGAPIVRGLMDGVGAPRPLQPDLQARLREFGPDGVHMAARLHGALPALALARGGSYLALAQQVHAFGLAGDVLLAIGPGDDVGFAIQVARAKGLKSIALGRPSDLCDVVIPVAHPAVGLALCQALEAVFFPG